MEYGKNVDYRPINTLAEGSPIEFEIPGASEEYLDLGNSMSYVRMKVVKPNGNNLADADKVGPVNAFLHSLFSQVEISLNGTPVTTASDMYAYRAYIETLLSYGSDAKKSQLTGCLFRKDKAGEFDKLDATNPEMEWRKSFIHGSRSVDMIGRIHADLFFRDRYILNEVNVLSLIHI